MKDLFTQVLNNPSLITGTSHIRTLEGVTNKQIKDVFGKLPHGTNPNTKYSDSIILKVEKEYEPRDITKFFDGGKGVYSVYTNFGVWRIGGFRSNKYIDELEQMIREA